MSWIKDIFRRRSIYGDLSEEIRLHIEERTELSRLPGAHLATAL